jgi:hypothetical protein
MTELERLYLNYLDMIECVENPPLSHHPMTFDEYKEARVFVQGMIAETDAERIIKAEAKRIEEEK